MTVTQKTRSRKSRPKLSLIEKHCLAAIDQLRTTTNGGIPSLRQIAEAMEEKRDTSRVSRIIRSLEKKGYIRRRLEIVEEGAA